MRVPLLLIFLLVSTELSFSQDGDRLLREGDFEKALEAFRGSKDNLGKSLLGQGIALYRLGRFAESASIFEKLTRDQDSTLRFQAHYNYGNALAQQKLYPEALKQFEAALTILPQDREARENYEYVRKLLEENESGGGSGEGSAGGETSDNSPQAESPQSNKETPVEKKPQQQNDKDSQGASPPTRENAESSTSGENQNLDERLQSLMNAVEGDRGPLMRFRQEKALEELEQRKEEVPEKDW